MKISLILLSYIVKFCGLCITVHHTQHLWVHSSCSRSGKWIIYGCYRTWLYL